MVLFADVCVGVRLVLHVTQSSQHALRLVVHCMLTHTGCVHRASITPTLVKSAVDAPVHSAMRLFANRLTPLFSHCHSQI